MPTAGTPLPLAGLRAEGKSSGDTEAIGRWALAEMIAPGGDAAQAVAAKKRLDQKRDGRGLYASLARAMYDEAHGSPRPAAEAYVATLVAAQTSRDADASLVAWYATHHLLGLRGSVTELYARNRATVESLLSRPGNVGWRAVAELTEWSVAEAFDKAEATGDTYDAMVVAKMGCSKSLRIAGPFGHGSAADRRRPFAAERPGPWPPSWEADPMRGTVPHILKTEQHRCLAASTEHSEEGVYYVETFVKVDTERDLLLAVQGAVKVWVDDSPVLERDLRDWGVWQRFGVTVRMTPGRHRVLARVLADTSSIRLSNPDGTPAAVLTDSEGQREYSIVPPEVRPSPNPIDAVVTARQASSPLLAVLASYAAHVEAMGDVASVLIDPLSSPPDAAPLALYLAATFARTDPALPEDLRSRYEREYHTRATKIDAKLWYPRTWLILDQAEQKGLVEGVEPLRKLALEFPEEPEITEQLARLYARLGWKGERMHALTDLATRFPDDVNALRLYVSALEEDGPLTEADKVAVRIKKLDPDAEVDLDRALGRHDWKAAIGELQRLAKRRPDRKEIATRIADVLERAGDPSAAATQLDKALAKNPQDSTARLRLADRAYAKGDLSALRRALAEALQAGAKGTEIREAVDLLEGASNLEPYRIDGRAVIKDFLAWEKSGKRQDSASAAPEKSGPHQIQGNAARVLDYSAIWVHPDGSSEMLEHEIQRIQSQEAIGQESEQQPPTGLVLRMRVIKPDGATLEPEPVSGKPTLTMPHLEVGDYLEIEHITPAPGDGLKGRRYRGPHWFFREADKGYWRSEFVCLTPKDKPVEIETRGNVGAPKMRDVGTFVERRWRVEDSPPALEEPDSPPIQEFLPSVRIGWGISLDDTVARLVDAAVDETPLDPRLHKRALEIVHGLPETKKEERARLIYKDILEHIEEGTETDGRRVILGKSGSRQSAFEHMMRQLGIPVEVALVKNRLAMPPLGKMSEMENYDALALRIDTENGVRWLTVRDKFAPFAYIPAEMRGQPAIRLVPGTPRDTVGNTGAVDGILLEGRANLREDGSASVELSQSFTGKIGITMRNVFDKVAEGQVRDFIESRILSRNLPGARLRDLKIENQKDLGLPLVVRVTAEVPQLARVQGRQIVLRSLFPMRLAQLATLPERQTPMLLGSSSHVEVRFQVVVPDSVRLPPSLPEAEIRDGERIVLVKDNVKGHALTLVRTIDIPAGRVQPGPDYARFQKFSQEADTAVEREIVVGR